MGATNNASGGRIWRSDVLQEAWKRVKRNKGATGVDAQTIAAIQAYGEGRFLEELQAVLRRGEYRPRAVRRCYIPKSDGKERPLGIPTVRWRSCAWKARAVATTSSTRISAISSAVSITSC